MIDGINNGGGPARSLFPVRSTAAGAADPGQPVRRIAAAAPVGGGLAQAGLVKELASAPPVNSAKVAALQAAIAAGTYRIDPDAIAGAMLALDQGQR